MECRTGRGWRFGGTFIPIVDTLSTHDEDSGLSGLEVLVVDANEKVLRGLERMLSRMGLMVTPTGDEIRARDHLTNKFFSVALVDADTPLPGGGIELLRFARERSPLTAVVVMCAGESYDIAVEAFRHGAADVIRKRSDDTDYLRDRVKSLAGEPRSKADRNVLLRDVLDSHEDFLRRMREVSKQVVDLEDKILGREVADESGLATIDVIVVDDDPAGPAAIEKVLTPELGWRIRLALSGGEALDLATQGKPQVLILKENLPDLPSSMIVKTIKATAPDVISILYTPPSQEWGTKGEARLVESSRLMELIPSFSTVEELGEALGDIREAMRQKVRERRYLQAFRQQNFEFIQRYQALRQRILSELGENRPAKVR